MNGYWEFVAAEEIRLKKQRMQKNKEIQENGEEKEVHRNKEQILVTENWNQS